MNEQELLAAYGELAAEVRGWKGRCMDERYAPGTIAGWVLPRLKDCASRLHYPVTYWHDPETPDALGTTQTEAMTLAGADRDYLRPVGIRIEPGMTPVSQARTLAHELSHALNHVQAAVRYNARLVGEGDPEEIVAECSSALICRALRVPSQEVSVHYIMHKVGRSHALLDSARADAVARASLLLAALA